MVGATLAVDQGRRTPSGPPVLCTGYGQADPYRGNPAYPICVCTSLIIAQATNVKPVNVDTEARSSRADRHHGSIGYLMLPCLFHHAIMPTSSVCCPTDRLSVGCWRRTIHDAPNQKLNPLLSPFYPFQAARQAPDDWFSDRFAA